MDELASFPKGRNDDQVDAISQALIRFQTNKKIDFDFDFSINDSLTLPSVWFR